MISTLVLTKNEEKDLPDCLRSLQWCDDIHVLDSYSTDKTVEVARRYGAMVSFRAFDGYAAQNNYALKNLPFKYAWLLILDADERLPEPTYIALINIVKTCPGAVAAVRLMRRDYLFGTWLKRSAMSPFNIRLMRIGRMKLEREINPVWVADGEVLNVQFHFDHFPFSKGLSHWVARHNSYSTMEAERALEEREKGIPFSLREAIFNQNINIRRYHQKGIFYKMPGRPMIKWCYQVFWRRSFLDGSAGLVYATLQAFYEFLIVQKEREIRESRNQRGPAR